MDSFEKILFSGLVVLGLLFVSILFTDFIQNTDMGAYCKAHHGIWNGECFIKQNNGSYHKIDLQWIEGQVVEVVE